jgi:hypothetical protein
MGGEQPILELVCKVHKGHNLTTPVFEGDMPLKHNFEKPTIRRTCTWEEPMVSKPWKTLERK